MDENCKNIGIPIKILRLPETKFPERKRKFGNDLSNLGQRSHHFVSVSTSSRPEGQNSLNLQERNIPRKQISQGC